MGNRFGGRTGAWVAVYSRSEGERPGGPIDSGSLTVSSISVADDNPGAFLGQTSPASCVEKARLLSEKPPSVGLPLAAFLVTGLVAAAACGGDASVPLELARASSVSIAPDSAILTYVGEAVPFTATIVDQYGQPFTGAVLWTTSSPQVFSVTQQGVVTALSNGAGFLWAASSGLTAMARVVVEQMPTQLVAISGVGQSAPAGEMLSDSLVVRVADAGDSPVSGETVTFSADDATAVVAPGSATTDERGLASTTWRLGERVGTQALTASVEGRTIRITISAMAGPSVPSVSFVGSPATVLEGESILATVSLLPAPSDSVVVRYAIVLDADSATSDADESDYIDPGQGELIVGPMVTDAVIAVQVVDDDVPENPRETLRVLLLPPLDGAEYVIGEQNAIDATIREGICDRTQQVRDVLLQAAQRITWDIEGCGDVTDWELDGISTLSLLGPGGVYDDIEEGSAPPWLQACGAKPRTAPRPGLVGSSGESSTTEAGRAETACQVAIALDRGLVHESAQSSSLDEPLESLKAGDFLGLTSLERLLLDFNEISELPAGVFGGLTGLSSLQMYRNNLTVLRPHIFSGLPNLQHLYLTHNQVAEIADSAFFGLNRLRVLNIRGNRLTALSESAFVGLDSLTNLQLGSNSLAVIPRGSFNELQSLETLSLFDNRLSELPTGAFEGLGNLQYLSIGENLLSELGPGLFKDLVTLRTLSLTGTPIEAIRPGAFGDLRDLEVLGLSGHQMSDLPGSVFSELRQLQALHLDGGTLVSVSPNAFEGLESLLALRLDRNQIASLPREVFRGLTNLEVLGLGVNRLISLPDGVFSHLTMLRELSLPSNQLAGLPGSVFANLENLRALNLTNNRLTNLPTDVFAGLTNLAGLRIGSNGLTTLPTGTFAELPQLSFLWIGRNPLTEIPRGLFSELHSLSALYLLETPISHLPADAFEGLAALEILNLRRNRLDSIPEGLFDGLTRLESLYLDSNRLRVVPHRAFGDLRSLRILNLQSNRIAELGESIFLGLENLVSLALRYNPGAPFALSVELDRVDAQDSAPGPAAVVAEIPLGVPFDTYVAVGTSNGSASSNGAWILGGGSSSTRVRITQGENIDQGTHVWVRPPDSPPRGFDGVELVVGTPLALFSEDANRIPVVSRQLPGHRLREGSPRGELELLDYFSDPDGDSLTFGVSAKTPGIVDATIDGDVLTLVTTGEGSVEVEVVATDPGGLWVAQSTQVTVLQGFVGGFNLDVVPIGPESERLQGVLGVAARRWREILRVTELPNIPVTAQDQLECFDWIPDVRVSEVDDLLVYVRVVDLDGAGGVLARAGPCRLRAGSNLPYVGRIEVDSADVAQMEESGSLTGILLHELGHVLGFGTTWGYLGLLRDPSFPDNWDADTHFAGALARKAFDEAGGSKYVAGAKVPVEVATLFNRASADSHWRESVLDTELMTSYGEESGITELSAITIQSLADLGYTVDVQLADKYQLPSAQGAAADVAEERPVVDDVLVGTVLIVDENGRVVRRIGLR